MHSPKEHQSCFVFPFEAVKIETKIETSGKFGLERFVTIVEFILFCCPQALLIHWTNSAKPSGALTPKALRFSIEIIFEI